MKDRAMQAIYLLALDPVAEATADPNSYGFRKERSCADAIAQCFIALATKRAPQWVLEGDIKACFDGISHDWLLAHVPLWDRTILRKWLKAGYVEGRTLSPTEEAGECEAEGRALGRKEASSPRCWRTWHLTDCNGS
jgi:RNA-directed DNA polymerase